MNNKITRINITVPTELKEWYQREAKKLGISMSAFMMFTLKDYKDSKKDD